MLIPYNPITFKRYTIFQRYSVLFCFQCDFQWYILVVTAAQN